MLAMHYSIPLQDADAVAKVRARAAERGPLFDGMPGLDQKLFLIDPVDPCYATFYLWRDPDAALAFLDGDFFAALSQAFGRPAVQLLLTKATELPFATGERVVLGRHASTVRSPSLLEAIEPSTGAVVTLGREGAPGRRFEVMYRAVGAR